MHTKSSFSPALFLGAAIMALGVAFVPIKAQAGFQWVPGETSDSMAGGNASVAQAPLSSAPVASSNLPQIIEGTPSKLNMPDADSSYASETDNALPPVSSTSSGTLSVPAPAEDRPVRGFANNVPLSVALRQILPQDYGFSVAQDVSLGTLVSWKGGSSWRATLKEMLSPSGLTVKEQGRMVHIVHDNSSSSFAADADSSSTLPSSSSSLSSSRASSLSGDPSLHYVEGRKPTSLVPPAGADRPHSRAAASSSGSSSSHSLTSELDRPVSLTSASVPMPVTSSMRVGLPNQWEADKGEMLHKVLEAWAKRANVELSWQAEYDYPLQASVSLTGTFEDAVRALLIGFQDAKPQPIGEFYNNQVAGQAILVVQVHGNNYNE